MEQILSAKIKMKKLEINNYTHRRKNILTGEWILVSPQRTQRPWQGEVSKSEINTRQQYKPDCYLCPGNKRANGEINPQYSNTFVFTNDFSALKRDASRLKINKKDLLIAENEPGICRVVNFSPRHDLTLAEMNESDIQGVVSAWCEEYKTLGALKEINYVQIFENKGSIMGNSNPHPHGQIWAQKSIPIIPMKELNQFRKYYKLNKRTILSDYIKLEKKLDERIVYENDSFLAVVPFWAVWPYEILIMSKRIVANLLQFNNQEIKNFANIIKIITAKYDNLFQISFPYSAGIHQSPTDGKEHKEWHFHMHFFPPLLRSATVKKFMVGYEMLAESQRDIIPEFSANVLRELPSDHFKNA
jgi:UDPglucose--hexose-1-phosphate uridylyltransferase